MHVEMIVEFGLEICAVLLGCRTALEDWASFRVLYAMYTYVCVCVCVCVYIYIHIYITLPLLISKTEQTVSVQ
jgi:hypothetical protein